MSTAAAGRSREYAVRDHLGANGWTFLMRAAASKGPADLLMAHPVHGPALIQVGTPGKTLGPADRERFVTAAELARAHPILATRDRTRTTYRLITRGTPRTWAQIDPATLLQHHATSHVE